MHSFFIKEYWQIVIVWSNERISKDAMKENVKWGIYFYNIPFALAYSNETQQLVKPSRELRAMK